MIEDSLTKPKPDQASREKRSKSSLQARRALLSGTMGSTVEWFDWALYGALSATVFPALFFHSMEPAMGLIASFATFGVGFFARPLGGVVFGYLGDRMGRRNVLLITFITMGASSIVVGILPPYSSIGVLAPWLLVVMRFIQGFALGGEATGAQLMTMEHAPKDRRAFFGAVMAMGSPVSQVLANLVLALLTTFLAQEDFLSWGWRLPFVLSIVLIGVGIYIRLRVEETPIFRNGVAKADTDTPNPLSVVRTHGMTILRLMLAFAPITVTFYIVSVFAISYMTTHGFSNSETFTIVMVANLLSAVAIWWGGRAADRFGRRTVLFIGGFVTLIAGTVFFPLIDLGSFPISLFIVCFALCGAQFGNAAQGALFAEAFPTEVRYSGGALALTGATLIFSAPVPFVASWLMALGLGTTGVTVFWVSIVAVALVNLLLMREGKTLEGAQQTFGTGLLSR